MSKQHASGSKGSICLDNCMCCHTMIQVADQTCYLTQSQYSDTKPTSPTQHWPWQLYVLPHCDRSCRPNLLSNPVTVQWHQANQSQSALTLTTVCAATLWYIQVADQTCSLTQSQYSDTKPTSPSTDPVMPGMCGRVAMRVPNFKSLVWLDPRSVALVKNAEKSDK